MLSLNIILGYVNNMLCHAMLCYFWLGQANIRLDIVSTKIYGKHDDFDFEIVNFPFLDGDVPRSTSYGVYISQLIRFARASSYVADFNTRNKLRNFLHKAISIINFTKHFRNFIDDTMI